MAINGKIVLLQVAGVTVAAQRDLSISQQRDEIDASSKDSDDFVALPGRSTREITLDALYIPGDTEKDALEAAYNNASDVTCQVIGDGRTRTAPCSVLQLDENHPDQDVSTWTARLKVNGGFVVT